jgi:hypothetical protein
LRSSESGPQIIEPDKRSISDGLEVLTPVAALSLPDIEQCRRVATRYDKLAVTFLGSAQIASLLTVL